MKDYRSFIGFYWTLPVPSAGFTTLPNDLEDAVQMSRTLRYQRELVRRHVEGERGTLVDEFFFLELAPDRGSDHIEEELRKALDLCRKHDAQLLFVDFVQEGGWRSHPFMSRLMQLAPVSCLGLYPEPLMIDGREFDPIAHFRRARKAFSDRGAAIHRRQAIIARVKEIVGQVPPAAGRYGQLAQQLNAEGVKTVNGRSWSEPNLRAFLKSVPLQPQVTDPDRQ